MFFQAVRSLLANSTDKNLRNFLAELRLYLPRWVALKLNYSLVWRDDEQICPVQCIRWVKVDGFYDRRRAMFFMKFRLLLFDFILKLLGSQIMKNILFQQREIFGFMIISFLNSFKRTQIINIFDKRFQTYNFNIIMYSQYFKNSNLSPEQYRFLDHEQKMRRIKDAKQQKQDRKPNPQGNYRFIEQGFLQFQVKQFGKIINLCTYRQFHASNFSKASAVMIMFHGLNSHIGHGAHIAHALQQINIITVGFDHRGFGNSQGASGLVESFEQHMSDSLQFVHKIKALYPNLPIFLLGLSMGGLTSYFLGLRYKELFQGIILMAPAIRSQFNKGITTLLRGMVRVMPVSTKLVPLRYGVATRNPEVSDHIKQDFLCCKSRVRLSTAQMLLSVMEQAPETYPYFSAPFLIVQGGHDKLVNPEGAFELYEQSRSLDKQLLFYDQMWHDVWHQQQIYEIIEKVKFWIKNRIPSYSQFLFY